MIVTVNGNTYAMSEVRAKNMLGIARDAMKGKNAIIGIRNEQMLEMRNEEFDSLDSLLTAVDNYTKMGLHVYYVRGVRK